MKLKVYFLLFLESAIDSNYSNYLFLVVQIFFFEFPVERDFDNEKAFNATQYPSLFQMIEGLDNSSEEGF